MDEGAIMAELDEPGDEPNFDLFGSFGLDFFSDDATFVRRRTFVLFFSERVLFNARNDRKLVQIKLNMSITCHFTIPFYPIK